ncbi:MAG TPA: glycosyltransferase family 2 protein [Terriglobales bacterium]|nr:glycosyltransferase family 2 protein [Terriglobales bacterium]
MTEDHTSVVTSVTPRVSVIVPARNEQDTLERCLRSLVEQEGVPFELLVVDDSSTDRTPEIITFFTGVKECPFVGMNPWLADVRAFESRTPVPEGWTGKANAIWTAVTHARGEWLLFTDADTFPEKGSLARAVAEAEQNGAVLLSYSPKQELGSLPERMLMPVIFSELATQYRPSEVSDPTSPVAAANGQYLLVRKDIYNQVGGHAAVAGDLLEDVALAVRVKESGGKLRFRVGIGEVSARMYRSLDQLVEGWTKNLVLLFPKAKTLAYQRATEFTVMWGLLLIAEEMALLRHPALALWAAVLAVLVWINFIRRIARAHAGWFNNILSIFGLPMFSWLLLRSVAAHRHHSIWWKGREYTGFESAGGDSPSDKESAVEKGSTAGSDRQSS